MDLNTFALGDVLREHRRSRPTSEALVCGGTRVTFAALDERVDALASGLNELGVGPGTRVMWLAQNCHRAIETLPPARDSAPCGRR